jgi:hypothetical protein
VGESPAAGVSFDACVDRRLVHRRAVGEVFLTSIVPSGPERWQCGVQISRGHRRMPHDGGPLPVPLVIEASRQAGMAISHVGLGVGLDQQYLLDEIGVRFPDGHPTVPRDAPFEAELDVTVASVRYRREKVCGLTFAGSWTVGGRVVVNATASMRCLSPGNYRALRRNAPLTEPPAEVPAAPLSTGSDGQLVVGWTPHDPLLFDHPVDHVPGMALVDAMLSTAPYPDALTVQFHQFAELNQPVNAHIATTPRAKTFTFTQGRVLVASGQTSRS